MRSLTWHTHGDTHMMTTDRYLWERLNYCLNWRFFVILSKHCCFYLRYPDPTNTAIKAQPMGVRLVREYLFVRCVWKQSLFFQFYPIETMNLEAKKLLNKAAILVFFAHNNYSCIFIKLRLNHWCHMDYFNDVHITFLGLECGTSLAVYICRIRKLSDFIKNILICVPKMDRGFTGLEWHEGE